MIYRAHVAEKTYGEGSPKVIPALCDLGDVFSETGKAAEAQMTFNVALNIVGADPPGQRYASARRYDPVTRSFSVAAKDSLTDPIIAEPLHGIARTYMRRMNYPDAWLSMGERQLDGKAADMTRDLGFANRMINAHRSKATARRSRAPPGANAVVGSGALLEIEESQNAGRRPHVACLGLFRSGAACSCA